MISNGKVVTLSYTLKNSQGEELDKATASEPFVYLHGQGQVVPGLETALEGEKSGAKKSVTIAPAEAYGELNPELKSTLERSFFPQGTEIQVGMRFRAQVGENPVIFAVEKVEGDQITINGNHPLAGETLHFELEIHDVREATQEELSHGHAHGPGGHHHH